METTNFFTQLAQLDIKGHIVLTIARSADDTFIVSTLVRALSSSESAPSKIIPYNLTARAEELDNCYFDRITAPAQKAGEIVDNMEEYLKSMENAKAKPQKEKSKTSKPQGEAEKRTQKYHDALNKSEELEKQKKYNDAWTALPKASEYPEHAELIRSRQTAIEHKIWPDLFANTEHQVKEIEQEEEE
ncbi:hypothetical protein LZQ00_08280 [Sphingobacterium sp. SRCM116780]|uniref:hypothetical protein n=1 Tax=Sphingobacterium sp. SRCM116780 TaxID=2907623 RepID=UPI001F2C8145|nr:hypothetical protein [Sphingobacterium sp. SRCM116780]UIR57804.1 hypothetical protein LZQ00_08280 [Sphingobacterium sp. SRCM116780]